MAAGARLAGLGDRCSLPLQQQLRAILDLLPEAQDFALAGGGALIVQGVVSRPTRDLDYFGPSEEGSCSSG